MSKVGFELQKTYHPGGRDIGIRRAMRDSLAPKAKPPGTNVPLFIALVTLAVLFGGYLGLLR